MVCEERRKEERQMETVIVEVRAGEGGDDAKALVVEQFGVYARMMERRGL